MNLNWAYCAGMPRVASVGIGDVLVGLFFNCNRWWVPGNLAINGSKTLDRCYNHLVPGRLRL